MVQGWCEQGWREKRRRENIEATCYIDGELKMGESKKGKGDRERTDGEQM